jgi:ribosomal protein S18 acetylase RimI-like enzyme
VTRTITQLPSGPVHIRPVHADECHAAGLLVVAAYQELPGAHMEGGYAEELAAVERRSIEAEVLVAIDSNDELVGCVTLVPDASSPWAEQVEAGESSIRMLAVHPSAQGHGIGADLLDACIERARLLGTSGVFLHSTPSMQAAHHIYEKAGFVRVPERDWLPTPDVPLLAFRLDLTPPANSG